MSISKAPDKREARWTLTRNNWIGRAAAVIVRVRALAPYALIELVLPGGSMIALLLWLYRQRKSGVGLGQLAVRLSALIRLANPLRFNAGARSALGSN